MKTRSTTSRARPPHTDWIGIATGYAQKVLADKNGVFTCKWTRLACQRYLDDLKRFAKKGAPYYLCPQEAARACGFFSLLPHVEGNWDTKTITLQPWQVFIVVNVFGWRRSADGRRRFTDVYIEVARKNGKSVFASGFALYALCCEGELGPQVKCAATTGDQARIVFDVAKKMVDATPSMRKAFRLEPFKDVIACYTTGGNMKPINSKASTQDGLNPHCSILDELHAHRTRDLFDVLKSARGARKNPLSVYITTAGYNTMGVCYEQHLYVQKILQNVHPADHYFGIIYTLEADDDPLEEKNWIKANPNIEFINLIELRGYAADARLSPETMAEFKTKRCNVWTTAKNGYINTVIWQKCIGNVDLQELEGVPCWAGLDLGSVSDLCSFRLVWKVGDKLKTWGRRYLPEAAVDPRTEKHGIPYRTWVSMGLIEQTPGNVTDYEYIERDIRACLSRFKIKAIGYDKWNSSDLVNRLMADGAPLIEYRQGPQSFNTPMREIERLYLSENLEHGGDPVLTWNASNVVCRTDVNQNRAPDKKHSFEKIDDFVTLAMATGLMMGNEGDMVEGESVYEQRGILEVDF